MRTLVTVVTFALLVACPPSLQIDGTKCDEGGRCPEGFRCDAVENVCRVASAVGGGAAGGASAGGAVGGGSVGGGSAGGSDAGSSDAGLDAGTADAGAFDAGPAEPSCGFHRDGGVGWCPFGVLSSAFGYDSVPFANAGLAVAGNFAPGGFDELLVQVGQTTELRLLRLTDAGVEHAGSFTLPELPQRLERVRRDGGDSVVLKTDGGASLLRRFPQLTVEQSWPANEVAVADMTSDGVEDLVVVNQSSLSIHPAPTFTAVSPRSVDFVSGLAAVSTGNTALYSVGITPSNHLATFVNEAVRDGGAFVQTTTPSELGYPPLTLKAFQGDRLFLLARMPQAPVNHGELRLWAFDAGLVDLSEGFGMMVTGPHTGVTAGLFGDDFVGSVVLARPAIVNRWSLLQLSDGGLGSVTTNLETGGEATFAEGSLDGVGRTDLVISTTGDGGTLFVLFGH